MNILEITYTGPPNSSGVKLRTGRLFNDNNNKACFWAKCTRGNIEFDSIFGSELFNKAPPTLLFPHFSPLLPSNLLPAQTRPPSPPTSPSSPCPRPPMIQQTTPQKIRMSSIPRQATTPNQVSDREYLASAPRAIDRNSRRPAQMTDGISVQQVLPLMQ